MKIKAVIIDDEKDVRFVMKRMIEDNLPNEIEVVGEADDVDNGFEVITTVKPDLVFLDVKMKSGTGFDLLEKFDELPFEVIFVTAYDNFAVKAFQFSALGYLLKPVKSNDLVQVVNNVLKRIEQTNFESKPRLKVLVNNFKNANNKQICVGNVEGFTVLDLKDIIRMESENNYTHFFMTSEKKITTSKTLKDYEKLLTDHGFYRIHQSHLINLAHIKSYQKANGGTVIMNNDAELPLARQRRAEFLKQFL